MTSNADAERKVIDSIDTLGRVLAHEQRVRDAAETGRATQLAAQHRREKRVLLGVGATVVVVVLVVGLLMLRQQWQSAEQERRAEAQRRQLKSAVEDISKDNIRASISVGSCLRAQAPDVESCALAKFEELMAAAERSP